MSQSIFIMIMFYLYLSSALEKPSYTLLPATGHPKAVGRVCHAKITDYTMCKHLII